MAVAIRNKGFTNIRLYNGGMKDWKSSGLPVSSIAPLPEYRGPDINVEDLMKKLKEAEGNNCTEGDGASSITLLDFRASGVLKKQTRGDRYGIKTACKTLTFYLDDLLDNKSLLAEIPKTGQVVSISETGNRDMYLQRYLFSFGFTNIFSLQYGMRAWIKAGYPTKELRSTRVNNK